MNLTVSSTENGDVAVVSVHGEIDVYTAPMLREALDKHVAAGRVRFVVDLTDVSFMDSTALGVLVGRLKLIRAQSGSLRVVVSQERVRRVFAITGLDKVFALHATVDEALAAAHESV